MFELYELNQQYKEFIDAVERGDIPDEAIADTLEAMNNDFDDAADNIACMIKSARREAEAMRDEERALAERRRAVERRAERLTEYLTEQMRQRDCKAVKTARNALSLRKSTAVEVESAGALVEWAKLHNRFELLTYKQPEPNKTELKKALEAGDSIAGAHIVERMNLQLK